MNQNLLKRFVQLFFVFSGAILGWLFIPDVLALLNIDNIPVPVSPIGALIGGLILFLVTYWLSDYIVGLIKKVEEALVKVPIADLMFGTIGLVIGLIVAFLITVSLSGMEILIVSDVLPIFVTVLAGYWGFQVGFKKRDELISLFSINKLKSKKEMEETEIDPNVRLKILDTSVIIDGRIADICQTGFLEGTLVIPYFVLEELQHIADSSDALKRNRGRRGLDILNKIQKELAVNVEIYEGDFEDIQEVDSKLVKLAKLVNGIVVTNDFNLNKVCELQNVPVLNINDLANAVKPVVLPGEELNVQVIKDGKEHNQGIGYLDDGTMIVVEEGRNYIGKTIDVIVTSVLQTSAGRMIFAKPKLMEKAL